MLQKAADNVGNNTDSLVYTGFATNFLLREFHRFKPCVLDCPVRMKKQIEKLKTLKGGWTKADLASLGVPWPPPKGWRKRLEGK